MEQMKSSEWLKGKFKLKNVNMNILNWWKYSISTEKH